MVKGFSACWVAALSSTSYIGSALAVPTRHHAHSGPHQTDLRSILTSQSNHWSSNTTISFPGSADFTNATDRWSIFSPPTYSAAVDPGTEEDISQVVNLARDHGFPFLTRSSGHGFAETLAKFQHGVSLDLSQWKGIHIDSAAQTITVQPGVAYRDIFDPLYEAGFLMQTGTCSCPSVIGVALGGGIGRFTGDMGLGIDALQSVRMVGADGIIKTISATSNSDLWWGIRGAGANFGVVTSATFKILPLSQFNNGDLTMVEFYLPAESSLEYFEIIEKNFSPIPSQMAGLIYLAWNSTINASQVGSNWVYFGPEDEARQALAPLFGMNTTYYTSTVPWNKLLQLQGGGSDYYNCLRDKIRNSYSLFQKAHPAAAWQRSFESLQDFFQKYPDGRDSNILLELFANQAADAVDDDETAWPWRDYWGVFQVEFQYAQGDNYTQNAANAYGIQMRSEYAKSSGYDQPTIFVNYARGDEALEGVYGADKLPRLSQLKRRYDPQNLFAYYHPIPMNYP